MIASPAVIWLGGPEMMIIGWSSCHWCHGTLTAQSHFHHSWLGTSRLGLSWCGESWAGESINGLSNFGEDYNV